VPDPPHEQTAKHARHQAVVNEEESAVPAIPDPGRACRRVHGSDQKGAGSNIRKLPPTSKHAFIGAVVWQHPRGPQKLYPGKLRQ
jgi:hypothetical protein